MIRGAETFRLLAASIAEAGASTAGDRLGDRLTHASDRWPELLTLAHKFYVGPELFYALERKWLPGCVPEEARELLAMTHTFNVKRNQAIRDQCLEALGVLDRQGIPTVMLNGGAWLFETPPDQLGRRMMRDLDILVPRAKLEAAVAALENLGYATIVDRPDWTYQYPPMGRRGDRGGSNGRRRASIYSPFGNRRLPGRRRWRQQPMDGRCVERHGAGYRYFGRGDVLPLPLAADSARQSPHVGA